MHKIIAAAVLALSTLSSLQAFDLIVPAPGESEYVLLSEDDEVFRVDDSVFYKKGLNGEVLVERYSAGITVVSYKGGERQLIVFLNAGEEEISTYASSLEFATSKPDLLIVNSPVPAQFIDEAGVQNLFISSSMEAGARAMLRRNNVSFTELSGNSILQIHDRGINVISDEEGSSGSCITVTCPGCGQLITVWL